MSDWSNRTVFCLLVPCTSKFCFDCMAVWVISRNRRDHKRAETQSSQRATGLPRKATMEVARLYSWLKRRGIAAVGLSRPKAITLRWMKSTKVDIGCVPANFSRGKFLSAVSSSSAPGRHSECQDQPCQTCPHCSVTSLQTSWMKGTGMNSSFVLLMDQFNRSIAATLLTEKNNIKVGPIGLLPYYAHDMCIFRYIFAESHPDRTANFTDICATIRACSLRLILQRKFLVSE
eukprot:g24718.t1